MTDKGDRALKDLAALFKERENAPALGMITGTVIADPPEIEIKIFGNIILRKDNLIFGSLVMPDEKRNFEIIEGEKDGAGASEGADEKSKINIDTNDGTFSGKTNNATTGITFNGSTNPVTLAGTASPPSATCSVPLAVVDSGHEHTLKEWKIQSNKVTAKGTIKFKNTLRKDDEVIILPTADAKTFFVLDWARRL